MWPNGKEEEQKTNIWNFLGYKGMEGCIVYFQVEHKTVHKKHLYFRVIRESKKWDWSKIDAKSNSMGSARNSIANVLHSIHSQSWHHYMTNERLWRGHTTSGSDRISLFSLFETRFNTHTHTHTTFLRLLHWCPPWNIYPKFSNNNWYSKSRQTLRTRHNRCSWWTSNLSKH